MRAKHIRFFFLAFACCSLLAFAQDSALINVTGGGTKGTIPVFTGAHKIGNSQMKQSSTGVTATNSSSSANALFGNNTSGSGGTGVYGQNSNAGESGTGTALNGLPVGTWGDGGASNGYGIFGTADDRSAGIFENNGPDYYTNFSFNNASGNTGFPWAAFNGDGAGCSIDNNGTFSCTGTKNAVVPVDKGKHYVGMAAIESPKVWFEDFGSSQLRGGVAVVKFDAKFLQTVNTGKEYHVFLTPKGDCKGLFVANETKDGFEVRELSGGNANVRFDYRITALRKGYETVRFQDHSREFPMSKDGRIRP